MMTPEKHELHHATLAELQKRIDRIEASAYAQAKKMNVHAPRKFARRSAHSQRVSQAAAWRTHLYAAHGVPRWGAGTLSPFISLDEMKKMHDELHRNEETGS
jgi:hypothetical protein